MKIIAVTSLDHPDLQPYRTLRRPRDHEQQGIFVAEGEKVVRRLLESSLTTLSFLMTPQWFNRYEDILRRRAEDCIIFLAEKELLESIVGFHLHQGIMAVARIPQSKTLPEIIAENARPLLLVAIEGLTNAENIGALVRNCVAFGVQALIMGETSSNPYLRRAVRNSMGAVFRISIVRTGNLVQTLKELRQRYSVSIVGAHPHAGSIVASAFDFRRDCCLVFGSEGEGLSSHTLATCDATAVIPMVEGVDSLNVASASAALLYEVRRQRG